jgi:hypothetical protein
MCATSSVLKKLSIVNNRTLCENSPNLVALFLLLLSSLGPSQNLESCEEIPKMARAAGFFSQRKKTFFFSLAKSIKPTSFTFLVTLFYHWVWRGCARGGVGLAIAAAGTVVTVHQKAETFRLA